MIDRRNKLALKVLISLTNVEVKLKESEAEQAVQTDDEAASLDSFLRDTDCILPDSYNKEIMQGKYTVLAFWKRDHMVILDQEPNQELSEYLSNRGFNYLVFGKSGAEWALAIQQYKDKLPKDSDDL